MAGITNRRPEHLVNELNCTIFTGTQCLMQFHINVNIEDQLKRTNNTSNRKMLFLVVNAGATSRYYWKCQDQHKLLKIPPSYRYAMHD